MRGGAVHGPATCCNLYFPGSECGEHGTSHPPLDRHFPFLSVTKKKPSFCGCLFLLSVWLSVAHTKLPWHFVLWLKNPVRFRSGAVKLALPVQSCPGNVVRQHAAAHDAQKPRGLGPKVCNFLTQQPAMLLKPFLILISAIKARYATSKDATTPLSMSGC